MQPQAGGRQHQTGNTNRDQQQVGHEIERELLQGDSAPISQAPVNRDGATGNNHYRGKVERMESYPGNQTSSLNQVQGKAEDKGTITEVALKLKVNPAKNQGKSNQGRNDAAPHDQKVHRPARETA